MKSSYQFLNNKNDIEKLFQLCIYIYILLLIRINSNKNVKINKRTI